MVLAQKSRTPQAPYALSGQKAARVTLGSIAERDFASKSEMEMTPVISICFLGE